MEYRVAITVRRKGQNYLNGTELKTEEFEDLDDLTTTVRDFIQEIIYEDSESAYRNEGNYED